MSKEKPITQDLGVTAVKGFFAESGWLFRELILHDYGVDALGDRQKWLPDRFVDRDTYQIGGKLFQRDHSGINSVLHGRKARQLLA